MTEPLRDADPFDPAALRLEAGFGAWVSAVCSPPCRCASRTSRSSCGSIRVRIPPRDRADRAAGGSRDTTSCGRNCGRNWPRRWCSSVCTLPLARRRPVPVAGAAARDRTASATSGTRAPPSPSGRRTRKCGRRRGPGRGHVHTRGCAAQPRAEWPDCRFGELLRLAFRERLIDSVDHPVVRRLRGLA